MTMQRSQLSLKRRSLLIGAGAGAIGLVFPPAARGMVDNITRAGELLSRPWEGQMQVASTMVRDGMWNTRLEATFEVTGSRFTGKLNQFDHIDGRKYEGYFLTRGLIWDEGEKFGIEIIETRRYAADDRPNSVAWIKPVGRLTFGVRASDRNPALAGYLAAYRGDEPKYKVGLIRK